MPGDYAAMKFWEGACRKEELQRMGWFSKNVDKLRASITKSRDPEVMQRLREEVTAKRKQRFREEEKYGVCSEKNTAKGLSHLLPSQSDWPYADTPMILPPPETRALLYEGCSKDGRGKKWYMEQRTKLPPHKRYEQPQSSNSVFGWAVEDLIKHPKNPKFAMKNALSSAMYSNVNLATSMQHDEGKINAQRVDMASL